MPLTAIQCENCGSALQVDSTAKIYHCPFCQTTYAMEQTINQTFQTTNIDSATIIDDGSGKIDQEIRGGEAYLQLKKYGKAKSIFEELTAHYAQKHRAWWGLARAITEDFTKSPYGKKEYELVVDALHCALQFAPADEYGEIAEVEKTYRTTWTDHCERLTRQREQKTSEIVRRSEQSIPPKLLEINNLRAVISKKAKKVKRWETAKEILPLICSVIVAITLFLSGIEGVGLIGGILLDCIFCGLFVFLPLKVILFLLTNAVSIPANAKIRRCQERIAYLQNEISALECQFEQEINAVIHATHWLDI